MKNEGVLKINIGSGPHGKDDWVNLDWGILPILSKFPILLNILVRIRIIPSDYRLEWPKNLKIYDCRKKLPFKSCSVDYIYTSHFVEHLKKYEAVNFLRECLRILKPGGFLRICVPDIEEIARRYLNKDTGFFLKLENQNGKESLPSITDLFVKCFYGYDIDVKPSFLGKIRLNFIRGHFWMYDYPSLRTILQEAGFVNIQRHKPTKGETPDIDCLDIHKKGSLFMEATKGLR